MIIKTAELSDTALDWAVATCIGFKTYSNKQIEIQYGRLNVCVYPGHCEKYTPSTIWAQGGPIIEREGISITRNWLSGEEERQWTALCSGLNYWQDIKAYGSTPLIAAMRCYVASKNNRLGNDIDVPDELVNPT